MPAGYTAGLPAGRGGTFNAFQWGPEGSWSLVPGGGESYQSVRTRDTEEEDPENCDLPGPQLKALSSIGFCIKEYGKVSQ